MLNVGIQAPDFTIRLDSGELFRLRDAVEKNNIILSFLPGDLSTSETREAYSFLQNLIKVQNMGVRILVISPKSLRELRKLLLLYEVDVSLAVDTSLEIFRNYRVLWLQGVAIRRLTYIIDKKGIIRERIHHQLLVDKHWKKIIQHLKNMTEDKSPNEEVAQNREDNY